ncbi:hypothetical protein PTB13_26610 [Bacillus sp. MHSD17]|nr:hypothetical protein [Bacillus sp. MHSD17]
MSYNRTYYHHNSKLGYTRQKFLRLLSSRIVAMSFCEPRSCCVHLSS